VLKFLDAFYSGDIDAAQACCDDEFDSITYAPIAARVYLPRS